MPFWGLAITPENFFVCKIMVKLNRRRFLEASIAVGAAAISRPLAAARLLDAKTLTVGTRTLEVKGRAARVWGIAGPGGRQGLTLGPGEPFLVSLKNDIAEATLVHWHGQIPPYQQDGVPDISQPVLKPGGVYRYDYRARPGSFWMHSHVGLQRQKLLSAPLIVRSAEDVKADMQDVTLFLHDFTFKPAEEILAGLKKVMHGQKNGGMAMKDNPPGQMKMAAMRMHLNDVDFDAYLANDRTLEDPDVVRVEPGGRVRLRVINGAASTNFWIDFGGLDTRLIAVDGNAIVPLAVKRIPLAMAQRADVIVNIPGRGGAWPVLALREGGVERTGIVLATKGAAVRRLPSHGEMKAKALDAAFETQLRARRTLAAKAPDRKLHLALTGGMSPYGWGLNGKVWGEHEVLGPKPGERVRMMFENKTDMSHPMHLHGHHFQIVAFNGRPMKGAFRDTVLVPARGGKVVVDFDANQPGRWLLHCHNAYHMRSGMMTELRYGV